MTLPRTLTEAKKAVFAVDWAKPLNPGPWYDGAGLNGNPLFSANDGSLNNQENAFYFDPDLAFQVPFPQGVKQYTVYPALYNLPVTSGNKCLVYDEGVFTFGSGAFTGSILDYSFGSPIYADYTAGNEGKITVSGAAAGGAAIGHVMNKNVFGTDTITVRLKGEVAIS
jgi:hypothetical protein